jgi:hypothetical protein
MPLSFLVLSLSVMTRWASVRCGKWPGSVSADPGCALWRPCRILGKGRAKALLPFLLPNYVERHDTRQDNAAGWPMLCPEKSD